MLTHFCILELACKNAGNRYPFLKAAPCSKSFAKFERGGHLDVSRYAYVGSLGPDLAAVAQEWLFDTMHWRDTNHFVLEWLQRYSKGEEPGYLAYIFGFLCHMAADIICHPYVNTFAGYYDKQPIKDMHKWSETNTDGYVLREYFGRHSVSDSDNKEFGSWGDVLDLDGELSRNRRTTPLCKRWCELANRSFKPPAGKKPVTTSQLKSSRSKIANGALGTFYDSGAAIYFKGLPGNYTDSNVVSHKHKERDIDAYVAWAVAVTGRFWKAASDWLKRNTPGRDSRFLEAVPNFNLDTGYAPVVAYAKNQLILRYEHSWARYASDGMARRPSGYVNGKQRLLERQKRRKK